MPTTTITPESMFRITLAGFVALLVTLVTGVVGFYAAYDNLRDGQEDIHKDVQSLTHVVWTVPDQYAHDTAAELLNPGYESPDSERIVRRRVSASTAHHEIQHALSSAAADNYVRTSTTAARP